MQPVQLYIWPISQSKEPRVPFSSDLSSGAQAYLLFTTGETPAHRVTYRRHLKQPRWTQINRRNSSVVLMANKMAGALQGQKSRLKSPGRDLVGRWLNFCSHISPSFPSDTLHFSRKTPTDCKKMAHRLTNSFQTIARHFCHCPVRTRPGERQIGRRANTDRQQIQADGSFFCLICDLLSEQADRH